MVRGTEGEKEEGQEDWIMQERGRGIRQDLESDSATLGRRGEEGSGCRDRWRGMGTYGKLLAHQIKIQGLCKYYVILF